MTYDFGENEKWNLLRMRAEIAASTARLDGRKKDRELALTHFEKLVAMSKTREGKVRALVGVALCCISSKKYRKALKKAGNAVELTKLENADKSECCKYIKDLAIETYNVAARRFTISLNLHKRER